MRRLDEEASALEPSETDAMTALGQNLRKITGVEGAVIMSRDGVVLTSDMEGDAEKEGAVAVFVGNAADELGTAMSLNPFDWGLVTMGKDRMLILERPAFFVGLLLSERGSPALVSAEAEKLLG